MKCWRSYSSLRISKGDAQRISLPMKETQIWSLGPEDPLEKEMATHSSILAWRIPWTEEPGGLQPMELQRVRHDSTHMHSREMLEARSISWSFLHLEGNTQSRVEKEPSCEASAPPWPYSATLQFCTLSHWALGFILQHAWDYEYCSLLF